MGDVRTILVIPSNKRFCSYYLNGNYKDKHSMKYEDIRMFVLSLITPPASVVACDLFSKYKMFLVNVKTNFVKEVRHNKEAEIEKLKLKQREIDYKKV